jgi:hypothetical protein
MIKRLFARLADRYRERRWFRRVVDVLVVLCFFLIIATIHSFPSFISVSQLFRIVSNL